MVLAQFGLKIQRKQSGEPYIAGWLIVDRASSVQADAAALVGALRYAVSLAGIPREYVDCIFTCFPARACQGPALYERVLRVWTMLLAIFTAKSIRFPARAK